MSRLAARLGVEAPIVQAGMGGGIAGHELAAAVSEAGGLGTIGMPGPVELARDRDALSTEIRRARSATARPLCVNLLLPFASARDFETASQADAVATFWGAPRRRTGRTWLHQAGSVDEARAAHAAGADAVIAQGVEAGGHVRGTTPALELLARVRAALPRDYPVLLAGGIADAGDVRAALDAGADAVVLGTRFLMSEESGARTAYKHRLLESRETVLTELFGLGWPAPHRVLWNEAAERRLKGDRRGPGWIRAVHRLTERPARSASPALQLRMLERARPTNPLLGPAPPSQSAPRRLLDAGPLYAGESVARIHDIAPAAEVVRRLAA